MRDLNLFTVDVLMSCDFREGTTSALFVLIK